MHAYCSKSQFFSHCTFFSYTFLQCMLDKVGSWNFDIFLFDRLTNGKYFDFTEVLKFAKSVENNLYEQCIIKCIHT